MVQHFLTIDSLWNIHIHHFLNQILRLFGNLLPNFTLKIKFPNLYFLKRFLVILPSKRGPACQQYIHDHSTAPNIAFFIILIIPNFRGNIIRRTGLFCYFYIGSKVLEVPKPIIFIKESSSWVKNIIFSGLKSRWTKFFLWQ